MGKSKAPCLGAELRMGRIRLSAATSKEPMGDGMCVSELTYLCPQVIPADYRPSEYTSYPLMMLIIKTATCLGLKRTGVGRSGYHVQYSNSKPLTEHKQSSLPLLLSLLLLSANTIWNLIAFQPLLFTRGVRQGSLMWMNARRWHHFHLIVLFISNDYTVVLINEQQKIKGHICILKRAPDQSLGGCWHLLLANEIIK